MFSNPESTPENTHGLSQKIQGTYFKISALYFKIYGLYFLPFGTFDSQQLTKPFRKALKRAFGRGGGIPVSEPWHRNAEFRAFEVVPTGVCEPNVRLECR